MDHDCVGHWLDSDCHQQWTRILWTESVTFIYGPWAKITHSSSGSQVDGNHSSGVVTTIMVTIKSVFYAMETGLRTPSTTAAHGYLNPRMPKVCTLHGLYPQPSVYFIHLHISREQRAGTVAQAILLQPSPSLCIWAGLPETSGEQ